MAAAQAAADMTSQLVQNRANRRAAERANAYDRESADIAYGRELELMKYQNDFNSPAAQMQRFKDAGLNPNLVYGQGSPGNTAPASPQVPRQAPAKAAQVSIQAPNVMQMIQQWELIKAQTELIKEKTLTEPVRRDLTTMQTEVAKANPYLAPGYLHSVVSNMESIARQKQQETSFKLDHYTSEGGLNGGSTDSVPMGIAIAQKQWDILYQKFRLGERDLKIKSEIIQSKEFQNELAEIQRNWMKNGEITPEVIKQFALMLMQALLR